MERVLVFTFFFCATSPLLPPTAPQYTKLTPPKPPHPAHPQALPRVLPLLCERGSWATAKAWSVQEGGELSCTASFADGEPSNLAGESASDAIKRVQETGVAEATGDVFVVPATLDGEVHAVFEFTSSKPMSADAVDDFQYLAGKMVATEIDSSVRPDLRLSERSSISQDKMDAVFDAVVAAGSFTPAAIFEDTRHYFNTLALPEDYFLRFNTSEIAQHLSASNSNIYIYIYIYKHTTPPASSSLEDR